MFEVRKVSTGSIKNGSSPYIEKLTIIFAA